MQTEGIESCAVTDFTSVTPTAGRLSLWCHVSFSLAGHSLHHAESGLGVCGSTQTVFQILQLKIPLYKKVSLQFTSSEFYPKLYGNFFGSSFK